MLESLLAIINMVAHDLNLPMSLQGSVIKVTEQYTPEAHLAGNSHKLSIKDLPEPAYLPENIGSKLASIDAKRAILVDVDSADVLFDKNSGETAAVASLSKLMTGLVSLEMAESTEQTLVVPDEINDLEEDSSVAGFTAGESYSVEDLLKALLIASANDAAITLAVGLAGSEEEFVEEMNSYARRLELEDTRFSNASGLDDADSYSTARDMAFMLVEASKRELLAQFSSESDSGIYNQNGEYIYLKATDKLLEEGNINILAAKTGFTDEAGQSFAVLAEDAGREMVAVILDSSDRFVAAESLLTYGFSEFSWDGSTDSRFAEDEEIDSDFGG